MSSVNELDQLRIPLKDIESATDNFDNGSFIGVGGFGRVYKAELSHNNDHSIVAIKRLDCESDQGEKEFQKEIAMLSGYKHENLASLLGFCDEGGEKILVYRHETHGSLDNYLRNTNDGYNLTWIQRLKICIGAARGLDYLHSGVGPQLRVIHRDIKSSNILLDENWEAKIADFGLSKIGPVDQQVTFLITSVAGTFGYCDPQYLKTCILTKESDVYSFGVVLFEVLCGRLACYYQEDGRSLARLARLSCACKNVDEIIDPNIRDQIEADSLKMFSKIAYQCLQEHQQNRPTMTRVVRALEIALGFQLQRSTFVHPVDPYSFARGIGVCYGDDLPFPWEVIRLCQSHNIQQMRLYSPNEDILQSLRGSNINVMVGVPNPDIKHIASSLDNAKKWMQENVIVYWPDVRFRYIIVGNEDHIDGDIVSQFQYLADAMTNLHQVIELNGLHGKIKVSTAFDDTIRDSYNNPFCYDYDPIKSFLRNNNTPVLLKLYQYHSYGSSPGVISIPYDPNDTYENPNVIIHVGEKIKELKFRYCPLLDVLYSSLGKALETGEGSLDLDKALQTREGSFALKNAFGYLYDLIFKAVEPGIYFRGDQYIFCFFVYVSVRDISNISSKINLDIAFIL